MLYSSSSGTTGTVTLSQSAANFKVVVIGYLTNDGHFGSTCVYSPNGKRVALSVAYLSATDLTVGLYVKAKLVTVSGTSISVYGGSDGSGYGAMMPDGSCAAARGTSYIKIVSVIGYK